MMSELRRVDEPIAEEHRRKRLRKGTRSCWSCKHRKIRCEFPDADTKCKGCNERGTSCVSQEFEDDHAPPSGNQLGQRLGRVEQMLEKLMQHVEDGGLRSPRGSNKDIPDSLVIDVLTPTSSAPSSAYENAPVLSLFDNTVFKQRPGDSTSDSYHVPNLQAGAAQTSSSQQSHGKVKFDRLRDTLMALLPSRKDIDSLSLMSLGWWLVAKNFLSDSIFTDASIFRTLFSTNFEPDVHPIVVTRLLLSLAICIQQLPSGFRQDQLEVELPVAELENKYMTIASLVTSDDELVGSLDGLECLLLQGLHQLNAGNFRRAWLSFHRAFSVGRLLGLHRFYKKTRKPSDSLVEARGKYLWYMIVKSERCIALVLGLPSGAPSESSFAEGLAELSIGPTELYNAKLCEISSLIADRNDGDEASAFATSQGIDDKLDDLAKTMPTDWWEELPPSLDIPLPETMEIFYKVIAQIWHYELEALLHLPFMYRAAHERRYEYSKLSCLKASREIVKRWLYLMEMRGAPIMSKLLDFQVFTSSVTLLLGIVSPRQGSADPELDKHEIEDRMMVRNVIYVLENRPSAPRDRLSAQSIEVLKNLESIDLSKRCSHGETLRLDIPHFGTITLIGGACRKDRDKLALRQTATSRFTNDSENQYQHYNPATSLPMINFESALFQPVDMSQAYWQTGDADVMLFDSILDPSLEGNWNF